MKNDATSSGRSPCRPAELFAQIMDSALEPLAHVTVQPDSFFESYRLVGVDGTPWSVGNAPTIVAELPLAAQRRLQAAFGRLRFVSIVDLHTHAPVAAVAAPRLEDERVLVGTLWAKVPERSLIVGDEFFGTPRTLLHATEAVCDRDVHFFVCVRDNVKVQVREPLHDGSAWVVVPVRARPSDIGPLRLREVRAIGRTRNHKRFTLRLWTTLSDPHRFPAETLARRYAEHWKPQLQCRELNLEVRTTPARGTYSVEMALQEATALILASAVLARLRVAAAQRHEPLPNKMSFLQVLRITTTLWETFQMMGDTLTELQRQHAIERSIEGVRQAIGRSDPATRYPIVPTAQRAVPSGERASTACPKDLRVDIEVVPV